MPSYSGAQRPQSLDESYCTAQLAQLLLSQLAPQLEGLRSRYRPERIGVILGTSTAGADVTEDAYRHYVANRTLPEGYDLWRHHTYGAILNVVSSLSGARGRKR